MLLCDTRREFSPTLRGSAMSAPINLEKKPSKPKDPYWRVVGPIIAVFVVAVIIVIIAVIHSHGGSKRTIDRSSYPEGTTTSAWPTTNPTPTCNPGEKPYNGLGADEGDTLCLTTKQWTIYQNMIEGKQKAADHDFGKAFAATGMSSKADRQGFAVGYKCDGTIYDENAASAAFSGKPSAGLLHGKVKDSSDFTVLRNKVCGYPMPTTPPPSTTTTLPPKCPPGTSDPACHALPPGASSPKGNPPTLEPKAPVPSMTTPPSIN